MHARSLVRVNLKRLKFPDMIILFRAHAWRLDSPTPDRSPLTPACNFSRPLLFSLTLLGAREPHPLPTSEQASLLDKSPSADLPIFYNTRTLRPLKSPRASRRGPTIQEPPRIVCRHVHLWLSTNTKVRTSMPTALVRSPKSQTQLLLCSLQSPVFARPPRYPLVRLL